MKFLSMLDPAEYQSILTDIEKAVDASLARHGFRPGHSAASVVSNVVSDQTARERHQSQMLALSALLGICKQVSTYLHQGDVCSSAESTRWRNGLDIAAAAVEREFRS